MEPLSLALLVLVGGVAALDTTAVGQLMISRPIVSGTVAGVILGDPATGLVVGGFLEIFLLPVVPVGGGWFPEGGPAAVVATAAALQAGAGGGLAVGLAAGLVWAVLGGGTIDLLRRLNSRVAPSPDAPHLTSHTIRRSHGAAIALDFLRGLLLTAGGVLLWVPLTARVAGSWPLGPVETLALVAVAGAVPLGLLLAVLGITTRRLGYFAVGLATGLLSVLVS